mgnify:CR=1 FL=1
MKKFGSFALAALMVTALSISASAANSFEAATGTPTIDGKMDDAYKAAPEIAINVKTSGDGKTSGTARVLWDSSNIYVFFDVTDPVLSTEYGKYHYDSDSVEFFISLADEKGDITKINAGQYTAQADFPGAKTDWAGRGMHQEANKDKATFKSLKTDKGYTVEMQIPFGSDYTPKAGAKIDVAFHINSDEDGKAGREGEYFAGQDQTQAWSKSDNYDTLTLTDKKYEAPKKDTAAATADMGIVAALAALASTGAAYISLKKRK